MISGWDLGGIGLLGAFHGLNPAMGWLFAVAIALQQRARRALLVALVPIAVGHAASVGVVVLLVEELGALASDREVRIVGAALLALFALWRALRAHRHPRWVGMRLTQRELAAWSFLMSSAHGAGLMLFPFLAGASVHHQHGAVVGTAGLSAAGLAVVLHTLAMVAVAGTTAFVVYEVVGVGILRHGWLNLDRLWAYALGAGAAATLFIA